MKIYIKFILYTFFKSFLYVVSIMLSLVFILNLLTELEFFKDMNVNINLTLFLSLLNLTYHLQKFTFYIYEIYF